MSKQDERARKIAEWMKHMQGWKDSGKSLAAYAKDHGLALWAMYHWRGVLLQSLTASRKPLSPICLHAHAADRMTFCPAPLDGVQRVRISPSRPNRCVRISFFSRGGSCYDYAMDHLQALHLIETIPLTDGVAADEFSGFLRLLTVAPCRTQ